MSLGLTNIQKVSLTQSLSPQIQLTIKLLKLNNLELEDFIQKKIEENPLLIQNDNLKDPAETRTSKIDDKFTKNTTDIDLINNINYSKSLREHLLEQLIIANLDNMEKILATYLINILDEAGYITEDDNFICNKLGISSEFYTKTINKLHCFEPTGVFSRNLRECLFLQLNEKKLVDEKLSILLSNIEILADDNYVELCQKIGVRKDELFKLINIIRKCNPKPGLNFSRDILEVIVPDIIIHKNPSGVYTIQLVKNFFNNLIVDESYKSILDNKKNKHNEFITSHYNEAKMVINSVAQRQRTLLRIANEIIIQQRDFLEYGINYMKPLNLEKIAKITNLHISTISRSVQNKFIETPRGTLEMKYFFDKGFSNIMQDEQISSKSIENRIKELIKKETPQNILSDDKIVKLLEKYDINIARRTVAKYRTRLNIQPSSKRKNKYI